MFWNKYPYTDMHELNLDWILAEIMKLHHDYDEFKAVNTITNAGAWDITKQYQAWTIVSDNNIGYISLKPVPKGVAITNIEYWGVVADYDILITDLSNRISTIEGQMTTLTGTTIPNMQNDIDAVSDALDLINNRRFIWIADSYAGTGGWVTKLNAKLGLTANVNSFCNAVGGEGFTTGTDGNGFLDELKQHKESIADLDTITDIFVVGGANDAETDQDYNDDALAPHISDFLTYARTWFPNAKIHFGFIGFCHYDSSTLENRTQHNLVMTLYRYIDNAVNNGCAYVNNIEYTTRWLGQATTNADGLHPNAAGGQMIANGLVNYLRTGSANVCLQDYPCQIAPGSGVTALFTWAAKHNLKNNNGNVKISEQACRITGTIQGGDAESTTRFTIATLDSIFVNEPIHTHTWMYCQGASPYTFMVDVQLYGNELSIVIMNAVSGGWEGIVLSNTLCVIGGYEFQFDPIVLG